MRAFIPGPIARDSVSPCTRPFHSGGGRSARLIYNFNPALWAALDMTYYTGGSTSINGVAKADRQQNGRLGATASQALDRYNSLKFYFGTGATVRAGTKFDSAGIVWQVRWGGRGFDLVTSQSKVILSEMKHATAESQTLYGAVSAVRSFLPIENRAARVLVLGSMPGRKSLDAGQYYAHQQNKFWEIMGELFGAGPMVPYEKRVLILKRAGLALWDVMASCVREGSLDADIDEASIEPNDFHTFFDAHPRVKHVFFNGAKAENCFRRHVQPHLFDRSLYFTRLPSTSPAHASLSLPQKLKAWRAVADALARK